MSACRCAGEIRTAILDRRRQALAEFGIGHGPHPAEPFKRKHIGEPGLKLRAIRVLAKPITSAGPSANRAASASPAASTGSSSTGRQAEIERILRRHRGTTEQEVLRPRQADEPGQVVHHADLPPE